MKAKVSQKQLEIIAWLIPFMEPQYFQSITVIHMFYKYIGYAAFLVLFCLFIKIQIDSKKVDDNKCMLVLMVYAGWLLFSCVKNNTSIAIYLSNFVPILGICLIATIYGKKHLHALVRALITLTNLMITINLLTVVLFPNGLYTHITEKGSDFYCWFLGYKNPQIRFFLPAIGFNFVYDSLQGNKISRRTIIIMCMILYTESKLDSSTSLVGLAVFALLYLLWNKKEKARKYFEIVRLSYFYIASCVISVLFIFYNIQYKFSFFIENILQRNVGLTARTIIWPRVILAIGEKPIYGYGLQAGNVAEIFISATHAHNYFLQQIYTAGVVGFVLMSFLWLVASGYCKAGFSFMGIKILLFISGAILVMGIVEALTEAPLIYLMLILIAEIVLWLKRGEKIVI